MHMWDNGLGKTDVECETDFFKFWDEPPQNLTG